MVKTLDDVVNNSTIVGSDNSQPIARIPAIVAIFAPDAHCVSLPPEGQEAFLGAGRRKALRLAVCAIAALGAIAGPAYAETSLSPRLAPNLVNASLGQGSRCPKASHSPRDWR
jgi:hypothetical protein